VSVAIGREDSKRIAQVGRLFRALCGWPANGLGIKADSQAKDRAAN
jgi:hypothetical protein